MDKNKVDLFLSTKADKFSPELLPLISEKLLSLDDSQLILFQAADFKSPQTIQLIAIFLGWDRFFLNDAGLGVLKILTCYGVYIWWIADICSAKKRTYEYNYRKFMEVISFCK